MRVGAALALLAVAAAAAVASCAPSPNAVEMSVTRLRQPPRAMHVVAPESVALYAVPPRRSFVDVALLVGEQTECGQTDGVILTRLRAEAARVGCDAVIVLSRQDIPAHRTLCLTRATFTVACVLWTDAP
jgi:hypothetical protein